MNFDRDEKHISAALNALDSEITTPDLMTGIQNKMQETASPVRKRRVLRPVLIAAAIAALLGVTAFAVSIGDFNWLLGKANVPFGNVVEETYQSADSNGMQFSIIAKKSYSDMSVLYVTLKDTEGLGRVNKDTKIAFRAKDGVQNCSSDLLYFDSETGIATFQLRFGSKEGFDGQPLKLEIEGISYGDRDVGEIKTDIDLSGAVANGENIGEPYEDRTQVPSEKLAIGHLADIAGTNSAWVSSIGVLHGYLTVQVGQPSGLDMYLNCNSLQPYLRAPDGNVVEPMPWGSGFVRTKDMQNITDLSQAAYSFDEHYFDVNTDDLKGYTLCFKGSTRELLKGDWKFDVDFGSIPEAIKTTADIKIDGVQMNDVTLTLHPLGMTLTGNKYANLVDAVVETTHGDVELGRSYADFTDPNGNYQYVWQACSAIDMDSVKAIRIGDNRIEIH